MRGVGGEAHVTSHDPTLDKGTRHALLCDPAWHVQKTCNGNI